MEILAKHGMINNLFEVAKVTKSTIYYGMSLAFPFGFFFLLTYIYFSYSYPDTFIVSLMSIVGFLA